MTDALDLATLEAIHRSGAQDARLGAAVTGIGALVESHLLGIPFCALVMFVGVLLFMRLEHSMDDEAEGFRR